MNLKISDLDSEEVKHQIQGLLWESSGQAAISAVELFGGGGGGGSDMPSALSVKPSAIHTNVYLCTKT